MIGHRFESKRTQVHSVRSWRSPVQSLTVVDMPWLQRTSHRALVSTLNLNEYCWFHTLSSVEATEAINRPQLGNMIKTDLATTARLFKNQFHRDGMFNVVVAIHIGPVYDFTISKDLVFTKSTQGLPQGVVKCLRCVFCPYCRLVFLLFMWTQFIVDFYNETYGERQGAPVTEGTLTLMWSLTTALFIPGGMIGSFLAGWLADKIGRWISRDEWRESYKTP